MLNKIIKNIEEQDFSIKQWCFSFVSILFVRFLLESLSSPTYSGAIPSDPYTLVHYLLFFLCLYLGTSIIVGYFTSDYLKSSKVVLFGLPLLWLAPILDIILSRGGGFKMMYVFDSGKNILFDFVTFFGPKITSGATIGMRVGIALAILGLAFYIYTKTKSKLRSFLGFIFIYTLVFTVGLLPSVIYTVSHIKEAPTESSQIVSFIEKSIVNSNIYHNTLREGEFSVSRLRFLELTFNKLMSQILFLLSFIFGLILFFKIDSRKFKSVLGNIRSERSNFYTFCLLCGMGFAYVNGLSFGISLIDLLGITCLVFSWVSLWMHAVHINDVNDLEIDKISNKERPLVKEELTKEEMFDTSNVWLASALLGSWSAGFYPFFMSLVYICCSYIYSSPPFRLRRFPIVSSFLIAIASLSTVLAGFFFLSVDKNIYTFPILLSFGIIVMVTLAINFKDIKDVEGDRENGIMTIPTLFPNKGVKIVGALSAISILLIPLFLSFASLNIVTVPCALASHYFINKKPYSEKPIFIIRFMLLAGISIFYIIGFLLIK